MYVNRKWFRGRLARAAGLVWVAVALMLSLTQVAAAQSRPPTGPDPQLNLSHI